MICCKLCNKHADNLNTVQCCLCTNHYHHKCANVKAASSLLQWYCKLCIVDIFPFSHLNNFEFLHLLASNCPSTIDSLPSFDILSKLSSMPNLSDFDNNNMLPNPVNSAYRYLEDFVSIANDLTNPSFSIFHTNISSLEAHFEELQSTLHTINLPFDVIGITETREQKQHSFKKNVKLDNYQMFSKPTNSSLGGVALYVNRNLNYCERSDLSYVCDEFETIWIEIKNKKTKNILCSCIYRHPWSNPDILKYHLETLFQRISRENKTVFLIGDFNVNLLNYDSHSQTNEFLNTLSSYFFLPYILQPSRVTERSATLIDNIYGNSIDHDSLSGNIVTQLSEHFPQFLLIKDDKKDFKDMNYYIHDYRKLDKKAFVDSYSDLDWAELNDFTMDCNAKFNFFLDKTTEFISNHAPLRKLSKRELKLQSKPWIDKDILALIKQREKLFKKMKNNPADISSKELYKKFRNRVVEAIRNKKKQYYYKFFHLNKDNGKKLWAGIKSIVNIETNYVDSSIQ